MSIERYPSNKPLPLSRAVRAGGFLFLSGVLPADASGQQVIGTIAEETRAVLDQISHVLTGLNSSLRDVVRVTVWLADLADFSAFNEVYGRYFDGSLPARSTVQAGLNRGAKIEIEVTAYTG